MTQPAVKRPGERTGRHFCASCFKELSAEEYLSGDFYCLECAEKADRGVFPLASTPNANPPDKQEK
jgi:hypothetical protein